MILFLLVCLPVLILGWIWFEVATKDMEDEVIESNKKLIQQTNEYLDLYITNLENSTNPLVTNPQIQHFINSKKLTRYEYFKLSETIEKELFSQMFGRTDIIGISLIGKNNMQINDYSKVNELLDMNQVRKQNQHYLELSESLNNFNIIGLQKLGSRSVVTITRKIHSNSTYLYEGLLVVHIDLKQISDISQNLMIGNSNVWIMDSEGQIIFHPNTTLLGTYISGSTIKKDYSEPRDVFKTEINRNKTIVLYEHSNISNWYLIAELPRDQIIHNLLQLRDMTLSMGALIIIVALSVIGGFSLSLTKSLLYLQKLMNRVESGDLTVKSLKYQFRKDEIGGLFKSFNKMVSELKRLYDEAHMSKLKEQEMQLKQKESSLQAMQSQINPHFLYNTLEIINSHAIIDNNMMISKMTTSLAHMFRYNIGNAEQVVTLAEEIGHIRSYLDIQQARFRKLQVDIRVDEEIMDKISTIRLTLQPLVENAFLHGYQYHKLRPCYIGIIGEKHSTYYKLRIIDRGFGMDPTVREKYNKAFSDDIIFFNEKKQFESIGLWNVHERLRLAFEKPYGLYIEDLINEAGTTIEIRLPYKEGEYSCIVS